MLTRAGHLVVTSSQHPFLRQSCFVAQAGLKLTVGSPGWPQPTVAYPFELEPGATMPPTLSHYFMTCIKLYKFKPNKKVLDLRTITDQILCFTMIETCTADIFFKFFF